MKSSPLRKSTWLALAMLAAVLGLLIILILHAWEPNLLVRDPTGVIVGILPRHPIWIVIEHIASALLILSLWHFADNWFLRKEARAELMEHIRKVYGEADLVKDANGIGITALYGNSYAFNWDPILAESEQLVLVFGSGMRWVARNAEVLSKRFKDSSKVTHIFLIHPESPMVKVIATKLGSTPEKYVDQITDTVAQLSRMGASPLNTFVRGHFSTDCHFLCVGDNKGFLTPRYFATRSRHAPIFKFEGGQEGSFLARVVSDIEDLKKPSLSLPLS